MADRLVEAGVQAEGQAITGRIDVLDQPLQVVALVAQDMEDRAEDFAMQILQRADLDDRRGDEGAVFGFGAERQLLDLAAEAAHAGDMLLDDALGLVGNDRTDIDLEAIGAADGKLLQRALEHGEDTVGDVFLQAQHAQRRAALAGAVEGRGDDVEDHLFGQRRGIDDHGVLAAGFGDQRDRLAVRQQARGKLGLDEAGDLGRTGEHHAAGFRRGDEGRPDAAITRQQLQGSTRDAGLMQDAHALRGDQRRFFRRLRQHRIAGDQRRGDLAGEDGEREVPRADADDRAERLVRDAERAPRLFGVVAQEIDGFAHFGNGVRHRLASLAHDQAEQHRHVALHDVGGTFQAGGALGGRCRTPACAGGGGDLHGPGDFAFGDFGHRADHVPVVAGVEDRAARAAGLAFAQRRAGAPFAGGGAVERCRNLGEDRFVRQVEAGRIPAGAKKVVRQGDLVVAGADDGHRADDIGRIGDQLVDGDRLVADAIDEGGVGAVFEQAADEIGQQRLMRTNRRIDAGRAVQLGRADDFVIERLTHAVQALELILAGLEIRAGQLVDRRQRLGIVGGELREDGIGRRQQFSRAGDVGDVGVDLAGIDREILETVDLGALDLGIPIGTLYQAHHDATVRAAGEIDDEIENEGAALAIGLHHETHAVPAGEIGVFAQALQQVERQFEAVGFLGVDVEADVVFLREKRQRLHLRQQFAHDALRLGADITRMQGRELDGNTGAVIDAATGGGSADGMDGGLVILVIALGIGGGGRSLAQHVVGIAETAFFQRPGALQRLVDGLAGDELLAHHAHRHVDTAADDRLAGARDEARQRSGKAAVVDRRGELAGDHEAPGGGVDEQRATAAHMRLPVAFGDLVADQRVAGGGVGNAQQGFGQAHQRHAFLAGERIFMHQPFDAGALVLGAQGLDQAACGGAHGLACIFRQGRLFKQRRDAFGLGPAIGRGDRLPERRLRADGGREIGKGSWGRHRKVSVEVRGKWRDFRNGSMALA